MKVCSICQRCYEDTAVSCAESEHPELSETRTGSPEMIAGYRLELLLESGIKGQVYRALRTDSELSCLITIVASNEENKQKFLQDAKTATTLFNQSVVDVYECGSLESGEVFVVAEDAAGQTVRELLNNVGVPQLLTTVQVVRQTAEAVHALHLTGLTHRAIRPENIILTTDAEHRLLVRIQNADLGGVAEHSIVSNKFLIDSALDSLRYFAPEQFSGEGSSVKSDVYSLGIVLYEMLAGTPPFDSDKASGLIDMHRNQRPPDVTIDNFDLRMLLTHTLMESLRKQSGKRQSSANAFARQLRHIEQLATHSPTPPPASVGASVPLQASVAPKISSPTNIASGPVATAARLAPIVTAPPPVKVKDTTPPSQVIVRVEPEIMADAPIPRPDAALEPGLAPASLVLNEIEDISEADLVAEVETDELPDIVLGQTLIAAKKTDSEPPKSRLKRMKKQLRTFTTQTVVAPAVIVVEQEGVSVTSENIPQTKSDCQQPEDDILSRPDIPFVEEKDEGKSNAKISGPIVTCTLSAVAAATALRKIDWEQPEEDIPSLDDIPAAFFSEPMPATPLVPERETMAPPVTVSNVPRKIEWEQPEDDIPSVDGNKDFASEQRAQKASIEPAATEIVMAASVSNVPRKIEWEQPEDDIPPVEETLDVRSREQISVASVIEPEPVVAASTTAPATPRKIDWVQPDDDIPSMEDVMEVMATEQISESALDSVQREMPTAPPIFAPKMVEWVQPDDDIPSMEDVVLANEQMPESAFASSTFEDEAVATPLVAPKKIEWVQPDDDIPSMEDVMEVMATEQIAEAALLRPTTEDIEPAPSIVAAKKTKLAQPDDDIPSMEDVMEVMATEQIVEEVLVSPVQEDVPAPTPINVPTKIEWVQPEHDIPSMEEALEVLSMEPSAEVPKVQADAKEVAVEGSYNEPASEIINVMPVVRPEPEEITLVSPPRRITIDWEQPKPWETMSKEIEFFPTLLGDVDTNRKTDAQDEPFFSDYYTDGEARTSDHYRSLMIGSGFIALIVLFLFGNDSVWNYLQNGSPADSVAVKTTSTTQTFPQSGQTTTPNDLRLLKSFEKPKLDDLESGQSKPSAVRVSTSSSDETSTASKALDPNKEPQKAASGRSVGKSPVVPSTLVISSDDGKISSKLEPQSKRSMNKKQGSSVSMESTRPRIVENPQP